MCRLETECEYLYSLSHASSRRYKKLITSGTADQIRGVSESVFNFDLFQPFDSKTLKLRKAVISKKRLTHLRSLFLEKQQMVQKILSVIFLTVITGECALAFNYDNLEDENI